MLPRRDRGPAAWTWPAASAVDVERLRRPATGRHAGGTALSSNVGEHEPAGRVDEPAQRRVVERADREERGHSFDEQRLGLVDIADPGERALVEERFTDRHPGERGIAQPPERLGPVENRCQKVRPEAPERRMERFGTLLEELDDRGIEADRDRAGDLEDEAGP